MKVISIFIMEFKKFLSGIKLNIFIYLLCPFIISYVYGMFYQETIDPNRSMPKFEIAVINNDDGNYSKMLLDVFDSSSLKKSIKVTNETDEKLIKYNLINGKIAAALIVPKDFTRQIQNGGRTSINILKSASSGIEGDITESIVKAFTDNLSLNSKIYRLVSENSSGKNATKIINEMEPKITAVLNGSYYENVNFTKSKVMSSKQYFSVSILIMFNMFFCIVGATSILSDKESGNILRLKSTTIGKFSYIIGKFSSTFLLSLMQITVFIVLTNFVTGVDWGQNYFSLIFVMILNSLFVSSASIFCATIFKSLKSLKSFVTPILMIFAFLGGAFFPVYMVVSDTMENIIELTPNFWFMKFYSLVILSSSLRDVLTAIIAITLISLAFIVFGSRFLSFEKTEVA